MRVKTVGGKHGKTKDITKHLCQPNLMPNSQVAHVMKYCICWAWRPNHFPYLPLFLQNGHCLLFPFSLLSQFWQSEANRGHTPAQQALCHWPLECSVTLSDVWRSRNFLGFLLLVLYVSFLIEHPWFSSLPQSPLRESPSFFFFPELTEVKHLHSIFFVMYSSRPSCQLLLVLCSWT